MTLKQSGEAQQSGTNSAIATSGIESNNTYVGNFFNGSGWNPFLGALAEVLVYNRPLSDAEVTQVRNYLSLKYGIAN
jgi:hypothetical protein